MSAVLAAVLAAAEVVEEPGRGAPRPFAFADAVEAVHFELDGGAGQLGAELGVAFGGFADRRFVDADELGGAALGAAEADGEADVVLHLVGEGFGSAWIGHGWLLFETQRYRGTEILDLGLRIYGRNFLCFLSVVEMLPFARGNYSAVWERENLLSAE